MKIEITKQTVANGENVYKGDIIEITNNEARQLVRLGKAIESNVALKVEPVQAPVEDSQSEAGADVVEKPAAKAPKKRGRKPKNLK